MPNNAAASDGGGLAPVIGWRHRTGIAGLVVVAFVAFAYIVPAFRAAQFANEECQQRFRRRPFTPWTYSLSFHHGRFQWGRLDPAGIHGYSAEVSFPPWGTESKVQVYFSIDEITMTPEERREAQKWIEVE